MNSRALSFVAEPGEIAGETSSTLKAFGVLEVLVRAGRPVTLSELMQATELPKPTLHRALALFEEAGFLAREPGARSSGSTCCATMELPRSGASCCGVS
jgi:DNA-binding MarR family transcriptional regulator